MDYRVRKSELDNGEKPKIGKWLPNRYGIEVKCCCMTCRYGDNDLKMTICGKKNGELVGCELPKNFICRDWKIKSSLNQAGKGDGKVKKKKYLVANVPGSGLEHIAAEMRRTGDMYEKF